MNHRYVASSACTLVIMSAALMTPVAAQQESCLPALQPDVVDLTRNVETNLVLLDRMLTTTKQDDAAKIGAKYEQYTFDYGRSKSTSNLVKKMLNIDYTNKERDTVYLSTLSDNAVEAYKACVGNSNEIVFTFAGNVIDTNPFFLSIDWKPRDRPADAKADLLVKVTQGTIEESGSREFRGEIQDRRAALVTVNRDPYEKMQIAVRIDNRIQQITIPARSKMRLARGIISSAEPPGVSLSVSTVETSGNVGGPVCVRLPNDVQDKFIVPESFKLINDRDQRQRVSRNDRVTISNEREVCAQIDLNFDTVFKSHAYVNVRGTAEVLMALPNH